MEYRRLGRTELQVSVLGVGGGYLMLLEEELGTQLYQRAIDLGLNYFDGRYGDNLTKLKPAIKRDRAHCVVATKTADATASGVLERIEQDLGELGSDYLDIFFLRCYTEEMLAERLAPGGAFDGLSKARQQGKIRFTGLANHSDPSVLVSGIQTGLVDVVLFPLNIVRREALETLIPVAQAHDVGLVAMKPLSVGKIPAGLGLRWLANQPIHTMVPGMSSLDHLETDVAAVMQEPAALSLQEEVEIERCRQELDRQTCRICDRVCQSVCERNLPIDFIIHHDVLYEHYRNLGIEAFLAYPMTPWAKRTAEAHFAARLAAARSCTRCGRCEELCPYHLPVMQMLQDIAASLPPVIGALQAREWGTRYQEAIPPYQLDPKDRRSSK